MQLIVLLLVSIIGAQADWAQINTVNTPVASVWHSCWLQGNHFVVYGGAETTNISSVPTTSYTSKTRVLDLGNNTWSTGPSSTNYTLVNVGNAVVTIGNTVYVWVGSTISGTPPGIATPNTVSRLSVFTTFDLTTSSFSFTPNPAIQPYLGTARGFGTAVGTPNGGIAVFGGSQGVTTYYNDFNEFNITTQTWTNLNQATDPNIPLTRSGCAAVVYKGVYYLFGGRNSSAVYNDVHSYDFATGLWSVVNTTGTAPTARFGSPNMLTTDGLWLIYGGAGPSGNTVFGDTFFLDLNTFTWSSPNTTANPPARTYSCGVQQGNSLYVYGGGSPSVSLNDFWVFTYTPPVTPTSAASSASNAASTSGTGTAATSGTGANNSTATQSTAASTVTQGSSTYSTPVSDATKVIIGFAVLVIALVL